MYDMFPLFGQDFWDKVFKTLESKNANWHMSWKGNTITNQVFSNTVMDVFEDNDKYVVRISAPGYQKKDFDISLRGKLLTVLSTVVYTPEKGTENSKVVFTSARAGGMIRCEYTFEHTVDQGNVKATYDAGILTITLVKSVSEKPSKIVVD